MKTEVSPKTKESREKYRVSFSTSDVSSSVVGSQLRISIGPMTTAQLRRYLRAVDGLSQQASLEEFDLLKVAGGETYSVAEGSMQKLEKAREFAKRERVQLTEERASVAICNSLEG
ncbi:MAG: hypothetical protein WBE86_02335 [Candidatus Acidiferrales bacterium]